MPADHRIGFDDLQRSENTGSQPVKPGKYESVDAGEGAACRGLTAQHIQLMPKHKDLGLQ
jgi:hypothetical protein